MATDTNLNPFLLAANVPLPDARLIPLLRSKPTLASEQDGHGYSLLHAAASYNHVGLLRQLVQEFKVDVNLKDEDGETCIFVTETVEVARCLVEELHVDLSIRNDEGQSALEKILDEGDYPEVSEYLRNIQNDSNNIANGMVHHTDASIVGHPPPLPPNMNINFNAVTEEQLGESSGDAPDPEFRRRIEELATRENFTSEEGQRELRELITDAVRGVSSDTRETRRRLDG